MLTACVVGATTALCLGLLAKDPRIMAIILVGVQTISFLGFVGLIRKHLEEIRAEINKPTPERIQRKVLLQALSLTLWAPVHGMLTVVMWPLSRLLK
ncbi:MAG TPA: hypothetical protein VFZ48_03980 [Candidatus Saccharimonadales bacterium]